MESRNGVKFISLWPKAFSKSFPGRFPFRAKRRFRVRGSRASRDVIFHLRTPFSRTFLRICSRRPILRGISAGSSSNWGCRVRFLSLWKRSGGQLFTFMLPYAKSASGSYVGLASSGTGIAGLQKFFIASSFFIRSYSSAPIRFS